MFSAKTKTARGSIRINGLRSSLFSRADCFGNCSRMRSAYLFFLGPRSGRFQFEPTLGQTIPETQDLFLAMRLGHCFLVDHFAQLILIPVLCESVGSFAEPSVLRRIDSTARYQHPPLPGFHNNTTAPHESGRAKGGDTVRAFPQGWNYEPF